MALRAWSIGQGYLKCNPDVARVTLAGMESQVFERVRSGELREASAVLRGGAYASQRARYESGLEAFHSALRSHMGVRLRAEQRSAWLPVMRKPLSPVSISTISFPSSPPRVITSCVCRTQSAVLTDL